MCYKNLTCVGGGHHHQLLMMSCWSVPLFQFYIIFLKLNWASCSFCLLRWPVFTSMFPTVSDECYFLCCIIHMMCISNIKFVFRYLIRMILA